MNKFFSGILVLLFVGSTGAVMAQSDEIIVTGSRLADYDLYQKEEGVPPHITIKKRASFLVRSVRVEGDTRQVVKREVEIRATLKNILIAANRNSKISLGYGNEFIKDFTEQTIAEDLLNGRRLETSYMTLLIKTPVDEESVTFSQAMATLDEFIDGIKLNGRTEILQPSPPVLSIVNPERFRDELLRAIGSDARNTAVIFGENYAVQASNMAERIRWLQSDELNLILYIPYKLTVVPAQ